MTQSFLNLSKFRNIFPSTQKYDSTVEQNDKKKFLQVMPKCTRKKITLYLNIKGTNIVNGCIVHLRIIILVPLSGVVGYFFFFS